MLDLSLASSLSPIDVWEYIIPNGSANQILAAWLKPRNAKLMWVTLIGQGGNGGAGGSGVAVAGGGGSGGAGNFANGIFLAALVPDVLYAATVVAGTSQHTLLTHGTLTTLTNVATDGHVVLIGAQGGPTGNNASGTTNGSTSAPTALTIGQAGSFIGLTRTVAAVSGVAGNASYTLSVSRLMAGSGGGVAGSAGAGGVTAPNVIGSAVTGNILGGAGGATATSNGSHGGNGVARPNGQVLWMGGAGGGGSGGDSGNGGYGGDGAVGCGGGGGGGGRTTGGAGGKGGPSYIRIMTW